MTNAEEKPVVHEMKVYVHAKYDDVWSHFTDPKKYGAWSSAQGVEFGAKVGETVSWGNPQRIVYKGKLTAIEKGKGLAHTFAFQGFGFDEETTLRIDLVAQGPVTLIHVRHDCTGAPNTAKFIGPLGWAKSISRLKTLLETGAAMPWPVEGK